MLGVYSNFPRVVHRTARFSMPASNKRLQCALVEAFFRLNNTTLPLEEVATPSIPECEVGFEFGVAEDNDFNYLDNEEKDKLLTVIEKKPFRAIDFLCILRYRKLKTEKKMSLKSDRYMLRLRFGKGLTQIKVFHEKGLMYTSPKDWPEFVVKRISAEFSSKTAKIPEKP